MKPNIALRWSILVGNCRHDVLEAFLRDISRNYYKFSFNSNQKSPFQLFSSLFKMLLKSISWRSIIWQNAYRHTQNSRRKGRNGSVMYDWQLVTLIVWTNTFNSTPAVTLTQNRRGTLFVPYYGSYIQTLDQADSRWNCLVILDKEK